MPIKCTTRSHKFTLVKKIDNVLWKGKLEGENGCSHLVVAKVVNLDQAQRELLETKIERLVQLSLRLDHVCAYRGTKDDGGQFYYIRDWYKSTLEEKMNCGGQLSVEDIISYGSDITRGMCELKEVDIVCSNLRPSNILLDEEERVFISDFGLRDIFNSPIMNGVLVPCFDKFGDKFAAPETWEEGNEPCPSSTSTADVWSLGCIILVMASNYCLWDGLKKVEISQYVQEKKLPIVLEDLVQGSLLQLVDGCLKYEGEKRLSVQEIRTTFLNADFTLHPDPKITKTNETFHYKLEKLHAYILQDQADAVRNLLDIEQNRVASLLKGKIKEKCALVLACQNGFEKCLKGLLNAGGDANTVDEQGNSVLYISIEKEWDACATAILDHGGSMRTKNLNNVTPLHLCIEMKNLNLLKRWITSVSGEEKKESINMRSPIGTPLCVAIAGVKNSHDKVGQEIVKLLLQENPDLRGMDSEGQTALHIAAIKDDPWLIKILLENQENVDIDIRNFRNRTPLHVALQHGAKSCIELLLKEGANNLLQDDHGDNAFHIAAEAALVFKNNLNSILLMLRYQHTDPAPALSVRNYSRNWTVGEFLMNLLPAEWISQDLRNELKKSNVHLSFTMPDVDSEDYKHEHRNLKDALLDGLLDARKADDPDSECTLIITEGPSAQEFALEGLSLLGNDKYGVYALQGKIRNVARSQLLDDKKVQDIFSALGLKPRIVPQRHLFMSKETDMGAGYICTNIKTLRYRHVMIMTDQDADGAHIKGLLINMFYRLCPALLKVPFFLQDFTTYLVEATHIRTKQTKGFKLLSDYTAWQRKIIPGDWSVEYFKGLGSSIGHAKNYFKYMHQHIRCFIWNDIDANYLDKMFNPSRVDERKIWICQHQITTESPYSSPIISCREFVKKELILYAFEDIQRSLPSAVDGLKPTQRKVIHYMLDKLKDGTLTNERITQLTGAISTKLKYHHGEESLEGVIYSMARPGTNNIDLLEPVQCSPDMTSTYIPIRTGMTPIASFIFPKEDMHLLDYINDAGTLMEPKCYVPIVPLALINSCSGTGVGFSTKVPNYHPKHVIDNIRRLMDGKEIIEMQPWYKNLTVFKRGDIYFAKTDSIQLQNTVKDVVKLEHLLPGETYPGYRAFLQKLKDKNLIEDFERKEQTFEVTLKEGTLMKKPVDKLLKLYVAVSTSMTYLLNAKGCVARYESPSQVMRQFYDVRLEFYKRRKEMQDLQCQLEGLKEYEGSDREKKRNDLLEDIRQKAINLWKKDLDYLEAELKSLYKDHWN